MTLVCGIATRVLRTHAARVQTKELFSTHGECSAGCAKTKNAQRFHAPYISQETVTSAYHFLGGGAAGEEFGGELILHGGQVPVQQIQGGMHPSRIAAVIPCLFLQNTASESAS